MEIRRPLGAHILKWKTNQLNRSFLGKKRQRFFLLVSDAKESAHSGKNEMAEERRLLFLKRSIVTKWGNDIEMAE